MFYYFKKGKNSTEMEKKTCAMDGEGPVTDGTCQKWFVRFLDILTFWPNNYSLWGYLMHWKTFSSTPGLDLLEARSER